VTSIAAIEVPEPVVLEIRVSGLALAGFTDMGTRMYLSLQVTPWASLVLVLGTVLPALYVGAPEWLIALLLVGGAASLALEVFHRRIFLTPTRLVRQSGILGHRQRELHLRDVEEVAVAYPRGGRAHRFGDVHVRGVGWGTSLVAVKSPVEVAQAILDGRKRLLEEAAQSSRRLTNA
jgi:hypothetical protein